MIFATQSQWSQATMTYSLLVRKAVCPPPSSLPGSPRAPRFPTEPELGGLPSLHKNTGGLSPPPPPSPFQLSNLTAPILYQRRHTFPGRTAGWQAWPRPVSPHRKLPATGCRHAAFKLTPDCSSLCLLRTPPRVNKGENTRSERA